MNALEILLVAISLALDCFAVSISCGLSLKDVRNSDALRLGVFFGGFQGAMALIGWLGGISFAEFIEGVDHWIALCLLALIGSKMIFEAVKEESDGKNFNIRNLRILLILSVATSIDALAVGVTFAFLGISIILPVILIAIMSFIFAFSGTYVGDRVGHLFGNKVEILGGIILIGLGFKILVEHMFF